MSKNDTIILEQLRQAGKALTAYEILDEVRAQGIKSPPQVYRSLTNLIGTGDVHKIESLNAFLACLHKHENENVIFLICDKCKDVEEFHAESVSAWFSKQVQDNGFKAEQIMVEVKGICRICQGLPKTPSTCC